VDLRLKSLCQEDVGPARTIHTQCTSFSIGNCDCHNTQSYTSSIQPCKHATSSLPVATTQALPTVCLSHVQANGALRSLWMCSALTMLSVAAWWDTETCWHALRRVCGGEGVGVKVYGCIGVWVSRCQKCVCVCVCVWEYGFGCGGGGECVGVRAWGWG
jgi:hypothetical protein